MGARTTYQRTNRQPAGYQQTLLLEMGGESVSLRISASRRKSMRLQVNDKGEVDLRIPLGCAKRDVLAFVKSNEAWLKQQRDTVLQQQQQKLERYSILGKELMVQASALDEFLVTDNTIWIPDHWDHTDLRDQMDKWLRPKARAYYQQLIDQWWPFFARFAEQKPVLRVKKMRTRWGSLSQRGYINLNLALMQLPEELVELVVVHELCHLKHFDHGPGFKGLMTEALPDWRSRERQLQQLSSKVL
ncbi:M48 family metallopeptidase [Bacterioplanoides sp.]|uniref:M48 family metallopeptidase n=1 Tax=Bacterioplanoides sp. TaxID=2066072 RepID=UPI003AFFB598